MGYNRQEFETGQILKADHLNTMESGIEANDLELKKTNAGIAALSRKILAISGGMLVFRKMLYAQQFQMRVETVNEKNDGETISLEGITFLCGAHKQKMWLDLSDYYKNRYLRISKLHGDRFTIDSMYANLKSREEFTGIVIGVDDKMYNNLDDFKKMMDDETYYCRKFMLTYKSKGRFTHEGDTKATVVDYTTTICVTSHGFTVMETIDNMTLNGEELAKELVEERANEVLPQGFIASDKNEVFPKAEHGKRLVFTFGSHNVEDSDGNVIETIYDENLLTETIENEGTTSLRKISFGGVD